MIVLQVVTLVALLWSAVMLTLTFLWRDKP